LVITQATPQFKVPKPFDFKKPEEWSQWKKGEESHQRQVSTLLYCLRKEAGDVFGSINIIETQRQKHSNVFSCFYVKKNMIFEPARFKFHMKQEGESTEQYIAAC